MDNGFKVTEQAWDVIASSQDENTQCTMQDLENIVKNLIGSLPKIDRTQLREEMQNMVVRIQESPTTFDINQGLSLTQGYKTRLVEIMSIANQEYKIRKRCVEMLLSANNCVSKATSLDKREGEAKMRWPMDFINLEFAEIFSKEVEQIYNNLKTTGDIVSRQGSMIQTQVDLGEYVRRDGKSSQRPNNSLNNEIDYHSSSPKLILSEKEWDEI